MRESISRHTLGGETTLSKKLKPNMPMKNIITIQLFDDKTKRKVEEIVTENIILKRPDIWGYHFNYSRFVGYNFMGNLPFYYTADDFSMHPGAVLGLYDKDFEEDVNQKAFLGGSIVGFAYRDSYSGVDARRGCKSQTDCIDILGYRKYVFDFPTQAANGTFKSVYLGYKAYNGGEPIRGAFLPLYSNTQSIGYSYANIFSDGDNVFLISKNTGTYNIDKIGVFDKNLKWLYDITNLTVFSTAICSGDYLNGKYYMLDYSGTIKVSTYDKTLKLFGTPTATIVLPSKTLCTAIAPCYSSICVNYGKIAFTIAGNDPAKSVAVICDMSGTVMAQKVINMDRNATISFLDENTVIISSLSNAIAATLYDLTLTVSQATSFSNRGVNGGADSACSKSLYALSRLKGTVDDIFVSYESGYLDYHIYQPMFSYCKLPASITKQSTQTLKVTYELSYDLF